LRRELVGRLPESPEVSAAMSLVCPLGEFVTSTFGTEDDVDSVGLSHSLKRRSKASLNGWLGCGIGDAGCNIVACMRGFGEPEVAVTRSCRSQYHLIMDISSSHN
jgi:hypothetical protein